MANKDEKYMQMALDLSLKGRGGVNPNPLVGAIIVKDDRVIGQGYHQLCGQNHAEINAFESATESVEGACMYVTLEPCSHFGKTPPCAQAVIAKGISRVVIGLKDPNPLVSGRGIKMLEESGIAVESGLLENELRKVNRVFLKYIQMKKPWVLMKTAMTLDGKIASFSGDSKWVSGPESRNLVHELRNELMGIMVGVNTIIADDPQLNTRLGEDASGRDPIRIVLDTHLRIPEDAQVLMHPKKTWLVCSEEVSADKVNLLKSKGVELIQTPLVDGRIDLDFLMTALGKRGIDGILLEGGGTLNFSALQQGIVDEVYAFIAPKLIGGENAKTPIEGKGIMQMNQAINLTDMNYLAIGNDLLIRALTQKDKEICSQVS